MANIADDADVNVTKILEVTIANRKQYGIWDKKKRKCVDCDDDIPELRLKSINAFICVDCSRAREL